MSERVPWVAIDDARPRCARSFSAVDRMDAVRLATRRHGIPLAQLLLEPAQTGVADAIARAQVRAARVQRARVGQGASCEIVSHRAGASEGIGRP